MVPGHPLAHCCIPRMRRLMWESMLVLMLCVAIGTSFNCTQRDPCLTKECASAAELMMSRLNMNANPCDNFEMFACGRMRNRQFKLSESLPRVPVNTNNHLRVIQKALAEQSKHTDSDALKKAKKLYTSCINYRKEYDDSIIKIIKDTYGLWPLTCPSCYFDEDEYDLITILIKAMFLGAQPLFSLRAGHHGVDNNQGQKRETRRLYIGKPELLWSVDTNTSLVQEQKSRSIYAEIVYTYAQRFGIENLQHAKNAALEIADTERLLAQFYFSNDSNVRVEKLTIETLYKDYGKLLNWKRLIPSIAESRLVNLENIELRDIVYVATPEGLKKVDAYFSTLSPRQLANFVIWRVIQTLDSALIREHLNRLAIGTESLGSLETNSPEMEADRCAAYVSKEFYLVAHKLLYDSYNTFEGPHEIKTIAEELHVFFILIFYSTNKLWKYENTSNEWREKIANLEITLFDYFKYDFQLNHIFQNIHIDENNFIRNVAALNKAAFIKDFRSIKQLNKFEDTQPPHECQPKYDIYQHKIAYSATVFKPPLFTGNVPFSVEYAGLGFSIAREMIHAVIYMAKRRYDDLGPEDWIKQTKTYGSYLQRVSCIWNQYNKYFYGATHSARAESVKKLYENIADIAGLKLAYRTWNKLDSRIRIKPLPVPFSESQVFFIQFAQNMCDIEETMGDLNKNIKNSPSFIRIIGSLINSKDFARVFRCPEGSPMNPIHKCELW